MSLGVLLALGTIGAYALFRKKKAITGEPGSGATVVRGPSSGIVYRVGLGEPGEDGRLVHSVFSPEGALLFTYVADENGDGRSLGPQTTDPALTPQVQVALRDFGFGR